MCLTDESAHFARRLPFHVQLATHHLAQRSNLMAHRLPCRLLVSATLLLLLAVAPGNAQQTQPIIPPPKTEPTPAAKELSAQEVDALTKKSSPMRGAEAKR